MQHSNLCEKFGKPVTLGLVQELADSEKILKMLCGKVPLHCSSNPLHMMPVKDKGFQVSIMLDHLILEGSALWGVLPILPVSSNWHILRCF